MRNPFKRNRSKAAYVAERDRLLKVLATSDPYDDNYEKTMHRLNDLDKLINRASEVKKAVIPALGTVVGVAGIYALQQFGGVIVPKALESLAARQEQKKSTKDD